MKPQMLAGAILTAIGIVALVAGSAIRLVTRDEVPHDGAAVKLSVKNEKVISIPPALGGLAVAGGLLLMVLAARK